MTMTLSFSDAIALSAFILGLISAFCAFVYWLISLSHKISKFIFDLKGDLQEIKLNFDASKQSIEGINRKIDYLDHIISIEFPQYFRNDHDKTNY